MFKITTLKSLRDVSKNIMFGVHEKKFLINIEIRKMVLYKKKTFH